MNIRFLQQGLVFGVLLGLVNGSLQSATQFAARSMAPSSNIVEDKELDAWIEKRLKDVDLSFKRSAIQLDADLAFVEKMISVITKEIYDGVDESKVDDDLEITTYVSIGGASISLGSTILWQRPNDFKKLVILAQRKERLDIVELFQDYAIDSDGYRLFCKQCSYISDTKENVAKHEAQCKQKVSLKILNK